MSVKTAAVAALTQDAFVPLWRTLMVDQVVVLMMHRFADKELNIHGDSADALRANLEFLRRHRFRVASLSELISADGTKAASDEPVVVFTVDDGYADFARIAAPVFAEFDCPVTVFVVTDAIEGKRWFWWDRVEYVIESSRRDHVDLALSTGRIQVSCADRPHVGAAVNTIVHALKSVPDLEKEHALTTLAVDMDVDVPVAPPPRYAAMTWTDVQRCEQRGVTFGPHTICHPMLTQTDAPTAASEILDSWARLQARCNAAVPVFCYPNGAYSPEHVDVLARSTMRAALTTEPRYATRVSFVSPDPATRFAVPRFPYSGERNRFVQVVAGIERAKMGVRHALRGLQRR